MIIGPDAFAMLLVEARFQDFTKKAICDATTQIEAILAVSAESREAVDQLADAALAAGGQPANEPTDQGFMYGRSFHDPDGHSWEVMWMDPSAVAQRPRSRVQICLTP
ncbi:MAG TPA: VOC family protein [Iamia sp.]|nr:VOC family protein [Iamia sp.]HXH56227.1 VOC family protein [Iamia sp.]